MFGASADRSLRVIVTVVGAVLIFASLALVAAFAFPPVKRALVGSSNAAYAVGERIDVDRALYAKTPFTVLLFARSTCRACVLSKPLMAAVVAALHGKATVRLVLAMPDASEDSLEFAREIGLSSDAVVTVKPGTLRLRTVPTIAVVSQSGIIIGLRERGIMESDNLEAVTRQIVAPIGS